ncbi:MAG TPA: hypothetical protein VNA22_01645, partial [Pyrinomonadaceae bacterium]|nr:hypothetical protein [Pyrinomonadaceae bacterium]
FRAFLVVLWCSTSPALHDGSNEPPTRIATSPHDRQSDAENFRILILSFRVLRAFRGQLIREYLTTECTEGTEK